MRTFSDKGIEKKGSYGMYIIGFILSVLLTAAAFAVAGKKIVLPAGTSVLCIWGAALLQILVHLRAFLHLDASLRERPNVLVLVFTLLILVLFVGGTIWIMSNLNYRMM